MKQNSFFSGCNYSNRDITTDATTGLSLCPVQDINKYGVDVNVNVDDTFSRWYCDLYLRQLKEALKHTMLEHESVFESQIHELHRLYWRQKELMMEMERTQHHKALYLNSGFSIPRSHWMCSSISVHQTRNLPHEENNPTETEAVDKAEKSEKKVLDLELPVFEYKDMNGEVHEAPNSLKEQPLESSKQLNKLQLDLNEPAEIEEHSDHVFNQLLSSVTSIEIGEDSVKGSHGMNEAPGSVKCGGGEHGIDLNMSPISFEEEVTIVKKFETEKPQESLSVSLHGKHRSEQLRAIVYALPCSNSILLLGRRYKRGSRPRKKVKLGPSKGSDLGPHSSVEKGSSTSLSQVKSARNQTNLGKKRRCKPQMKSSNGDSVVAKKRRKKSRRICLVTEGNFQEISAAETLVDMSRKSGGETSECINSKCRNLLWFAEISSSVFVDCKIDCFEAMTEKKLEEQKKILRLNSKDKETAVSSIVLGKQRRRQSRQGKRKCKDDQDDDNPSFSECEANEDVQVIGKLIEVNWGAIKKRRRGARIPATDFQHMIIN